MAKTIQLRNVPEDVHRALKSRAALLGLSLSDYLLAEIKKMAKGPTLVELRKRVHKREPISADIDAARIVREERERP